MAFLRSPAWTWLKVLACLAVLDVLLFRVGLLFWTSPTFPGSGFAPANWGLLFDAAREFEAGPRTAPPVAVVGSSVVHVGVDVPSLNRALDRGGLPPRAVHLSCLGASATDTAVTVWNSLRMHPWLVIYGATTRDFPKLQAADSPVLRVFYEGSAELPGLPRATAEEQLDAQAKRIWKLYRYRFFAHHALLTGIQALSSPVAAHAAAGGALAPLPPEAYATFDPVLLSPAGWAAWQHWRQTGKFSDFLSWNPTRANMMEIYRAQTMATNGPDGNVNVEALDWMLEALQRADVRTVLLYFPENPVFHEPEAKPYFDESLSRAYADVLKAEAAAFGARFEDLRDFLAPEEMYDMIHPNLIGQKKLTNHIAHIIAQEWRARQGE